MEKIYLQELTQHAMTCYIGKADPRKLVRMAMKIEMSETQDAQRPLQEKRVKEIAKYVEGNDGILPNTLTLATRDNRIVVKKDERGIDYIEIPETEEEFSANKDLIDVMDGQHRLYSFLPDIRQLHDDIKYEIGFTLYIQPTLPVRRKIFVSCNEKQEKVSPNLLIFLKDQLNMLSGEQKLLYYLVSRLNEENPLRGRIIMSAEKIRGGIKAKELMEVIRKAKLIEQLKRGDNPLTENDMVSVICTYLSAWERVVGFSFTSSSMKEAGAAIKISGLRFMLHILPAVWQRTFVIEKHFSEMVEDTIKNMISAFNVEYAEFFTHNEIKKYWASETSTGELIEQGKTKILAIGRKNFDPLGNI